MSTSAHERQCWQFSHAARDIANSLFQKWAIKGFFPECRAAGFLLHTFLSPSKEKCERPVGRQVPLPRRSRCVRPLDRKLPPAELSCNAACRGLSARPLHLFGSPAKAKLYPIGLHLRSYAVVGALIPRLGTASDKVAVHRHKQGNFYDKADE